MQNFKAIKTIGFVLGTCVITWIPSLILSSFGICYALVNNRDKYNALLFVVWPWLRQSLLLPQQSIHLYIISEMKTSAEPFAVPFAGWPVDIAKKINRNIRP